MKIGTLAARASTNVPTIRYYESIGLLPKALRREGGQRTYTDADVQRLTFIRRCREFGFSIDQVRSLDALGRDHSRSCMELRDVAAQHLASVRARIRELNALAGDLDTFVHACAVTCAGGPGPDCTILGDLATGAPVMEVLVTARARPRRTRQDESPAHARPRGATTARKAATVKPSP